MGNLPYYKQIDMIKKDAINTCNKICNELAVEAKKGLASSVRLILENYYSSYDPDFYGRNFNLYNMIVQKPIKMREGNKHSSRTYTATVLTSPYGMKEYYDDPAYEVYYLVWSHAIRGKEYAQYPNKKGWIWNPSFTDEYSYKYKEATPDELMIKYINEWGKIGRKKIDGIVNKYRTNTVISF